MRHLIVARWQEDTSWVDDIPGWEPLIVTKGVHLPNIGREASSYLWGMHHLYDRLEPDDLVACLQGWPFPHVEPDDLLNFDRPFEPGYTGLGAWHVSDALGYPDHPSLGIRKAYEMWVGREFPGSVEFVAGAQFVVSADRILWRPKDWYERMVYAVEEFPNGPWVMERLWKPLFELEPA